MSVTKLMGILNVTPDSCFDQGRWFDPKIAIQRGLQMVAEGADWIDIGGESTRPGAEPVSAEEELTRVLPVLAALKEKVPTPLSIDTQKFSVARAALEAGATLINDISGFRDPAMRKVAAEFQCPICVMHMQGDPKTMQINPTYPKGIFPFLLDWFKKQIDLLLQSGVKEENIILDPGIGFGKTVADNIAIVQNLPTIKALGFPILIGLSRKSFLGNILHKTYPELLPATLVVNTMAVLANVDIIRVHDIPEHLDLIKLISFFKNIPNSSQNLVCGNAKAPAIKRSKMA